ncbi:MAG TPA: ribokinase [Caulobacteraceae bacterium]|jgi:ribokinase
MSVCVLGSLNLDIVAYAPVLPKPGETVIARRVERLPGGKGANQAVAAARSGARTRLLGAVGRDEAGDALLAAMREAGVEAGEVMRLADRATGQAFVWVSETGENSIVVDGGANLSVAPGMFDLEAAARSRVVLAQLETPTAAVEALLGGPPAAAGCLRLLNAAPADEAARRLLPLADIVIVNEVELAAFARAAAPPEALDDVVAAARGLIARPDQTVVVTLGKAGAVAVGASVRTVIAGRPATTVDATGAGDCFCGALAARLAEDAELGAALLWANAAAALSTERRGAAPSMPTRADIEAALAVRSA